MRMSRLAVLPLVAGVAIGVAACGKSDSPTPPGGGAAVPGTGAAPAPGGAQKFDLCGVLTLDRAKQLIGDDAKQEDNAPDRCSYTADSPAGSVTVNSEDDSNGEQFEASRNVGGPAEKVSGVGDDAYYHGSVDTLYVRKGGININAQIVNGSSDDAALTDLEKKLISDILAKGS